MTKQGVQQWRMRPRVSSTNRLSALSVIKPLPPWSAEAREIPIPSVPMANTSHYFSLTLKGHSRNKLRDLLHRQTKVLGIWAAAVFRKRFLSPQELCVLIQNIDLFCAEIRLHG